MKLDTDAFPVGMVNLEEKKVLVRSDLEGTTMGKNVIVSDDLRNKMIKPRNPEPGVWKENVRWEPAWRMKPTSSMLIERYMRQQQCTYSFAQRWVKRERSPVHQ
jgi:hypothetical protein